MNPSYFNICTNIDYSNGFIEKIKSGFPDDDFVNESFDLREKNQLRKLIIIFSTERSGSTYLCELINNAGICLPHEYFQPYNYMPLLASRWGALENKTINIEKYCKSLINNRTSSNGVLGINLHGSHIYLFEQAKQYFKDVEIEYFFLKRNDIIAQAVSYEIAFQNSAWTSGYKLEKTELKYDFETILKRLRWLEFDLLKIETFCKKEKIIPHAINFKELASDVSGHMWELFNIKYNDEKARLKKQSTKTNKEWINMFCEDLDISQERPLNFIVEKKLSSWSSLKEMLSKLISHRPRL